MSVQQLPSPDPASDPLPPETRGHDRQPCAIPTICQPASIQEMHETRWQATIREISNGGLSITLKRRFEKGAGLAIELPGDGIQAPSIVFVTVIHVTREVDGAWLLGCRFLSELSDDQLQRLITATNYVLTPVKSDDGQTN